MIARWLKRVSPRSLFVRALLILLLPVVLLQLVVGLVFIQRHYEGVTVQMAGAVARDLNYAAAAAESAPSVPEARAALDFLSAPLGLAVTLEDGTGDDTGAGTAAGMASGVAAGMADPGPDRRHFYDLSGRAVIATLQSAIASPVSTDLVSDPRLLHIRLATGKGLILAEVPRARVAASNPHQLLVLMVFAALVLTAISILFLRNQIAPILALASAAEAFGKGQSIPYQPRGAEEVRRAGRAFLSMRSRIERQIEARTLMLSGVSHDLRTPITRMKLSLSLAEDTPETAALAGDLAEMEHMLEEFLTFARGEREEEPERFDAAELIRALAADTARGGRPLELALPGEPVPVTLRRMALMRALTNLTGNALRYGQRVRLTLDPGPGEISFRVEDDGPGIPEEQYEEAVKPFTQLDPARNRNRGGGVGLGLAIAQDVAFSHGGRLELGRSPLGGLSAALRLPR